MVEAAFFKHRPKAIRNAKVTIPSVGQFWRRIEMRDDLLVGGSDENNPSDMGAFIENCDRIRQECKAHLLIVHHSGKNQARGTKSHSSLKAAIDTEVEV